LSDLVVHLFEQPIPVVAAVQGAAVGAGFGLAMTADFRVASHDSRFVANFAQLGFHHGWGLSVTLPLVTGHQGALEVLYTGRRIPGDQAYKLGIADRLVATGDIRRESLDLARKIANSAPLAVRSIRRTMRGHLAEAVRAALVHETAEQERLLATKDCREGLAAMAQRRTPVFIGE
jgi:enoyl-CoA hydratase/carnithine racemase